MPRLTTRLSVLLMALTLTPLLAADDEEGGRWTYDEGIRFESRGGAIGLRITNRAQLRFTYNDPDVGESKGSFDIARYKLALDGRFGEEWEFRVQAELAEGSQTSVDLLEDAFFVYKKRRMARLWIGQGKVAFGRQEMTDSGRLQFVDRSIASERFAHGRDVGAALIGRNDKYGYSLGIYNGNGINKDEGDNLDYLGAARLIVTPLGPYELEETNVDHLNRSGRSSAEDGSDSRLAIGVSAMTNTTGTEGFEEERVERGGLELAYRLGGFNFVAEFFTESADIVLPGQPQADERDTDGWYAQAGYLFGTGVEVAGRFSEIVLDDSTPLFSAERLSEAGVALGYYFRHRGRRGHRYKIQGDYRLLEFDERLCGVLPPACPRDQAFVDRKVVRVQFQRAF